jgi:hypothetical protein
VYDEAAVIDGEMLPEIPQALTRYSANDPKFPVNNLARGFSPANDQRASSAANRAILAANRSPASSDALRKDSVTIRFLLCALRQVMLLA